MVGGQDGRSTNSERASFDCKTAEDGLYAVSKRTVVDTHRKHVEVNDSLESDQADLGLKRVGLSSDSSSMDVREDAHEQGRPVSPRERRQEDPPTPRSKDCEAFYQRWVQDKAPPMELLQLEANKQDKMQRQ